MHPLATPFRDRRIVLCVAGGIAAYKSVQVLRDLVKAGAEVQVAMTASAQKFVTALTFQTLSGSPVFTDLFDNKQDADIGHIRIADGADMIVVAPATANLLARLCAGLGNDPVTAAVLASTCPVLLAPAMNVNMWASAATKHNVETLTARGMHFVGPESGFLACQWTGAGRLSEPATIVEAAASVLVQRAHADCAELNFVVSAGGTEEALDPVRFLGNRSTGKMGYAIAAAAVRRGANVQLISGPTALGPVVGAERIQVRSASQMHDAVMAAAPSSDVVVMAAAVADYRPVPALHKLKKDDWGAAPSLSLTRTRDILAALGKGRTPKSGPFLVGFAAETENLLAAAQAKLASKKCDLIVANDVSASDRGFGADTNEVHLVWAEGSKRLPLASKSAIAHGILDTILETMLKKRLADE